MKKQDVKIIKNLFTVLSAQPYIKIIYLSGSSARNTAQETSDIDINIIYDDILYKNVDPAGIAATAKTIHDTAKKFKLNLHIQPPKSLSMFWDLVRSGEPWILTEIESAIPIHDNSDFITSLQSLLKRGHLYKKHERSSLLIDRAKLQFVQVENSLYSEAINILTDTLVSNMQAILMYFDKFVPYGDLPKELKILQKKDLIKEKEHLFFITMLKLFRMPPNERKRYMTRHKISIDNLIHSSTEFLERTEYLFELLEYLQKRDNVKLVYEESLKLMKEVINEPIDKKVNEDKIIIAFEAEIQKKKYVPKAYFKVIREIMEMKLKVDQNRLNELSSHKIAESNATIEHLKELIKDEKHGTKKHA